MSLQDRLVSFIKELGLELDGDVTRSTQLFKSGLLDSLSLFNLAEWIEQEINKPVDLTEINILEEWETIGDVLDFIDDHRGK